MRRSTAAAATSSTGRGRVEGRSLSESTQGSASHIHGGTTLHSASHRGRKLTAERAPATGVFRYMDILADAIGLGVLLKSSDCCCSVPPRWFGQLQLGDYCPRGHLRGAWDHWCSAGPSPVANVVVARSLDQREDLQAYHSEDQLRGETRLATHSRAFGSPKGAGPDSHFENLRRRPRTSSD